MKLPSGARHRTFSFTTRPSRKRWPLKNCSRAANILRIGIVGAFNDSRDWDQLVHIATDGESYGHHHPHGEMALAYALEHIEKNDLAKLTNYGEYLEKHPPQHEAEIHERARGAVRMGSGAGRQIAAATAAAMATGIRTGARRCARRWTGCAMNSRRSSKRRRANYLNDPWAARNEYINVILDRSPENRDKVFRHACAASAGERGENHGASSCWNCSAMRC